MKEIQKTYDKMAGKARVYCYSYGHIRIGSLFTSNVLPRAGFKPTH